MISLILAFLSGTLLTLAFTYTKPVLPILKEIQSVFDDCESAKIVVHKFGKDTRGIYGYGYSIINRLIKDPDGSYQYIAGASE